VPRVRLLLDAVLRDGVVAIDEVKRDASARVMLLLDAVLRDGVVAIDEV
jgi:hypothetical protein